MSKLPSLNPYSIGIWSATLDDHKNIVSHCVLILILLEYGLRHIYRMVRLVG